MTEKSLVDLWRRPFRLLRRGPQLLFRSGDLAVRVSHPKSRTREDVQNEKHLIVWLADQGMRVPSVVEGPEEVRGCPTLAYRWIEEDNSSISWYDFGFLVKRLHELEPPVWLKSYTAPLSYKDRTEYLLSEAIIDEHEAETIRSLGSGALLSLRDVGNEDFLLHGDLHTGNILSRDGLLLIDFEDSAKGALEVDFSSILQRKRFFSLEEEDFDMFLEGYGQEIPASPVSEAMIELRVANSITHLLLGGKDRRAEGRKRLHDLVRHGLQSGVPFFWRDI